MRLKPKRQGKLTGEDGETTIKGKGPAALYRNGPEDLCGPLWLGI